MPSADPTPWSPPADFDDYVLVRQLGEGASGLVWLAEDAVLCRPVAIKFAAAEHLALAARQRFVIEARAAARVQHPNVVLIYRVGELLDRPYLISEFVRGQTLDKVVKPVPWRTALDLGIGISRGLAAAHRQGVLHCDLKPANVILGDDGVVKIFDFELAVVLPTLTSVPTAIAAQTSQPGATRSASHGLRGTPGYMAPELWRAEPPTRRGDVYALCAVLYELCNGHAPFHEVSLSLLPTKIQQREALPLDLGQGAAARFAEVIERGLRRDPADRFASADELREALEGVLRTLSLPTALSGNPYRGLRAFDADHRALFFGRDVEVGVVLDRLRAAACVLVAGDSGVGKSSLCRAGVLPAVEEGILGGGRRWSVITFVPGRKPLAALCDALAPWLDRNAGAVAGELADDPRELVRLIRRKLADDIGLLIFIDQLEELITVADPDEAKIVDAALGAIAEGVPGLRLVGTLRADFLSRFAGLERLSEDLSRVLYFLRPLSSDRIREAIIGPAQATGAHFESEAMVDALVNSTARAQGGLPLLQFALAELWESRDRETSLITERALEAAGGVAGALTRHADTVLSGLLPLQRAAARRILLRMVTLEGTRARRTEVELAAQTGPAKAALDALVRGRLVVAQDAEVGSAYELAHEVLVSGWETLKRWLSEEMAGRTVRTALATQAAEWERLSRSSDALIGNRQLKEIDALAAEDLSPLEISLIDASRRAIRLRRWIRSLLVAAIPLLAIVFWVAARHSDQSEIAAHVALSMAAAHSSVALARSAADESQALRESAFAHFDHLEKADGERDWERALVLGSSADRGYGAASRALEAAFAQDPGRQDTRDQLADALYEQALLAEREDNLERRDDLVQRFTLYDSDGSRLARFRAPASLRVTTGELHIPASVTRLSNPPVTEALGNTPIGRRELAPGSYLLSLEAPDRAVTVLPFLAHRGEDLALEVPLPLAKDVPDSFVYIPPGRFLFGSSADEDTRKSFFNTVPMHALSTAGYFISREEITYADWLLYLEALPEPERTLRSPSAFAKANTGYSLSLKPIPGGGWRLSMPYGSSGVQARLGEDLIYGERKTNPRVDWRKLPVTGISALDVEAYAAWLRSTGKNPRARLCSEVEWERAARGADGRIFPQGSTLSVGDANIDDTYGREGMGLDEVGTHTHSRSPFGVDDMSGNAFEWTNSLLEPGQYVGRGGSYFHDRKTAELANRDVSTSTLRDVTLGARLCADLPR